MTSRDARHVERLDHIIPRIEALGTTAPNVLDNNLTVCQTEISDLKLLVKEIELLKRVEAEYLEDWHTTALIDINTTIANTDKRPVDIVIQRISEGLTDASAKIMSFRITLPNLQLLMTEIARLREAEAERDEYGGKRCGMCDNYHSEKCPNDDYHKIVKDSRPCDQFTVNSAPPAKRCGNCGNSECHLQHWDDSTNLDCWQPRPLEDEQVESDRVSAIKTGLEAVKMSVDWAHGCKPEQGGGEDEAEMIKAWEEENKEHIPPDLGDFLDSKNERRLKFNVDYGFIKWLYAHFTSKLEEAEKRSCSLMARVKGLEKYTKKNIKLLDNLDIEKLKKIRKHNTRLDTLEAATTSKQYFNQLIRDMASDPRVTADNMAAEMFRSTLKLMDACINSKPTPPHQGETGKQEDIVRLLNIANAYFSQRTSHSRTYGDNTFFQPLITALEKAVVKYRPKSNPPTDPGFAKAKAEFKQMSDAAPDSWIGFGGITKWLKYKGWIQEPTRWKTPSGKYYGDNMLRAAQAYYGDSE